MFAPQELQQRCCEGIDVEDESFSKRTITISVVGVVTPFTLDSHQGRLGDRCQ